MPPAELHTDEPEDRSSSFADASRKADNRPADAGPAACPGRLTTVRWTMHAPLIPISYTESFALVGHPATGYFRASNPVRFTIQVGLI
jgi:hypothetical protein